ncbi:hypothetical protein FOZ60_007950 [Perkinsus olseni]|uniref:BRCT domain-containing protein n=1 Tax=Perkinsus olseni TaxID=32597 RepID=A0A7J6NMT5_PEROL|nr:hypothetical protein FOZ60_007950 [Perkinsus olseni]
MGANLEALTGFGTSNVFAYVLEDGTSAPPNASSESLQVSARWVLGCAESQSLLPVSSSVLYKPCCSRLPLPRFTGVSAMLTDKNKEIFEETKRLVRALGGRAYTTAEVRNSSPGIRISHIICYDSAQVTTRQNLINWAKKCKAIIVFTEWLYACLRQGERVSEQPFTLVLHQEPKRKSLGGSEILPLRGFTVYIEGDGEDLSELDALIDSTGAARSSGWPGHRVPTDCLQTRVAVLLGELKRSSVVQSGCRCPQVRPEWLRECRQQGRAVAPEAFPADFTSSSPRKSMAPRRVEAPCDGVTWDNDTKAKLSKATGRKERIDAASTGG